MLSTSDRPVRTAERSVNMLSGSGESYCDAQGQSNGDGVALNHASDGFSTLGNGAGSGHPAGSGSFCCNGNGPIESYDLSASSSRCSRLQGDPDLWLGAAEYPLETFPGDENKDTECCYLLDVVDDLSLNRGMLTVRLEQRIFGDDYVDKETYTLLAALAACDTTDEFNNIIGLLELGE